LTPWAWVPLIGLAGLLTAGWMALGREPSRTRSPESTAFWCRFFAAAFLLPLLCVDLIVRMDLSVLRSPALWYAIGLTSLFEGLNVFFLMRGVKKDYYATSALSNTTVVFTVLLAPQILPGLEHFAWLLLVGSALVALGGFIFYKSTVFTVYGLLSAVSIAFRLIFARSAITQSKAFFAIVTSFFLASLLIGLISLVVRRWGGGGPGLGRPTRRLLLIGLISGVSTGIFYYAVEFVPIVRLGPLFHASHIVFAFLLGFFVLGERKAWRARLVGGLLVAAGAALVICAKAGSGAG